MVYFLAEWDKDKPRTWSGTPWGLYTALSRRIDVIDIDTNESAVKCIYRKVLRRLLGINDMDMGKIRGQGKNAMRLLPAHGAKVVQIAAEVVPDTPSLQTYIYIDVSISYIKYMAENLPDVFAHSWFEWYPKASIDRRAAMQDRYFQGCSGILTMGKWLANDLVERCGLPRGKVHQVGGGINLDSELIDYSQKRGNKILFVGRNFTRKGGHLVYEAFCHLKKVRPDAELYIVGPDTSPYPDNAVPGYVWMGYVGGTRLEKLFNQCDVFVMPSIFKAYGLAFIEALSFGLPCIGRDAYEAPYFIEDGVTGRLLRDNNAETLAGMMDDLLSNETIKRNVRDRRDWYLREYSWDSVAVRVSRAIGEAAD